LIASVNDPTQVLQAAATVMEHPERSPEHLVFFALVFLWRRAPADAAARRIMQSRGADYVFISHFAVNAKCAVRFFGTPCVMTWIEREFPPVAGSEQPVGGNPNEKRYVAPCPHDARQCQL